VSEESAVEKELIAMSSPFAIPLLARG
jgi:hypothetical protein